MKLSPKILLLCINVLIGWLALLLQLHITIRDSLLPLFQTLGKYFSYFTILSNMMAAFAFSYLLFQPKSDWGVFFNRNRVFAAITVYMVVVAGIYNIVLRPITNPTGMAKLINEVMHVIMPLTTLIYWLSFIKKDVLEWKLIWCWLTYPFLYICLILISGNFSQHYPYPFVNVINLGYQQVGLNSIAVALLFAVLSLLMIGLSKVNKKMP